MNNILITSSGGPRVPEPKPELLNVPDIKLPKYGRNWPSAMASDTARAIAVLHSEVRGIGALIECLGSRLESLVRTANPEIFTLNGNPFKYDNITQLVILDRLRHTGKRVTVADLDAEIKAWLGLSKQERYEILSKQPAPPKPPEPTKSELALARQIYPLLLGASRQLELIETAMIRGFGENSSAKELLSLISTLRTHAEEARLRCRHDPAGTAIEFLSHMRSAYKLQLVHSQLLGRTAKTPTNYAIKEFDPKRLTPDSSVLDEIEEIHRSLLINPKLNRPQEGFAALIGAKELAADLKKPGARLFVPTHKNHASGSYLMFTNPASFPVEAVAAISEAAATAKFPTSADGWIEVISLAKASRKASNENDFSYYRHFSDAVMETARAQGIERLWCTVRVGTQANTAMAKHLAVGWKGTGIGIVIHGRPYEVLVAHPFENWLHGADELCMWSLQFTARTRWVNDLNELTALYQDFRCAGTEGSRIPDFDPSRLSNLKPLLASIEHRLGEEVKLKVLEPKGLIDHWEIRVVLPGNLDRSLAIRQKIPGKDLWKLEEWDYYLLGNGKPMMSFDEIVANIDTLRRR